MFGDTLAQKPGWPLVLVQEGIDCHYVLDSESAHAEQSGSLGNGTELTTLTGSIIMARGPGISAGWAPPSLDGQAVEIPDSLPF